VRPGSEQLQMLAPRRRIPRVSAFNMRVQAYSNAALTPFVDPLRIFVACLFNWPGCCATARIDECPLPTR